MLADSQQKRLFVFAHLPFDKMRGGELVQDKTLPGVPKEDILKLLKDYGVTHMFVGHMHHNETREVGGMTQIMTNTAGSVLYDESQKWGYNTVFVKDGEITKVKYTEVDF